MLQPLLSVKRLFFFWTKCHRFNFRPLSLIGILEIWGGGELLWFASGGGDNQPILSLLFFLFLQSRCIPNQRGRCGKKQMYLSRAAPRAEDEGTLPVLSSNHVPTIVSPTTPNHSSHSLETQQNWKFQESLSWVVSFWWLVSKTIFPQRLSWVSGAPALHYSPELPVSPGEGGRIWSRGLELKVGGSKNKMGGFEIKGVYNCVWHGLHFSLIPFKC